MIARVSVALPFFITVIAGDTYAIHQYDQSGYKVRLLPPQCSHSARSIGYEIRIDQRPAYQADILLLEFQKVELKREKDGPRDPSPEFILETSNSFIRRLRGVAQAPQAMELINLSNFRIEYFNDDGTPLAEERGLVRVRVKWEFAVEAFILDEPVWKAVNGLAHDFQLMPWDSLLLDARYQLPNVGVAVLVAYSALEVMIERVLDQLAEDHVQPLSLWEWINERDREPTVENRFDVLLKLLTGSSLKDSASLWQSFKELKQARNSFVHAGKAVIGKKRMPVSVEKAGELVNAAKAITDFVLIHHPEHLRPKVHLPQKFQHKIDVLVPVVPLPEVPPVVQDNND